MMLSQLGEHKWNLLALESRNLGCAGWSASGNNMLDSVNESKF